MKSVLMIGIGSFGYVMTEKLLEEGNDVLVVEKNEARADAAVSLVQNIQIGDASSERFLQTLGVRNFDMCVIAIGDDFATVLEITVLLKDLGAKFILARASTDVHKKLLLRNGADRVVFAERELAERLAVKYGSRNIFDYIELTPEVSIYEIAVPPSWYGKSILQKSVRTAYHICILATKQGDEIFPLPHPDHVFSAKETIMVMGSQEDVKALTKLR
ncbi:MAG: potassium channel family protein [Fusicatenibacter sp.]|nr:TrkA family potassium uptake protein [Fusicatenibacter sp.]